MKTNKTYIGLAILLFGLLIIAGCDTASNGLTGNPISTSPSTSGSEQTYPEDSTTTDSTGDATTTDTPATNTDDGIGNDMTDDSATTSTDSATTGTAGSSSGTGTSVNVNDEDMDDTTTNSRTGTSTSSDDDNSNNLRFESYEVEATVMNVDNAEVSEEYMAMDQETVSTTTSSGSNDDEDTMEESTTTTSSSKIIFRSANGTTRVSGSQANMWDAVGTIVVEEVMRECNEGGLSSDCSTNLAEGDRLEVYFPEGSECLADSDEDSSWCDDGEFNLEEGDTVRGTLQIDTEDDGYRMNRFMISSIS